MAHIDPKKIKHLTNRMIDIYSPSGKENDILDYLKNHLKRRGVKTVSQPVEDNRYNLIIPPENDDDIELALIGHIDTVSAYDIEDYGFLEENGRIYGLGASDMKAGCAAMIEAFLACRAEKGTDAPVALCLVVGEEESGDGAKALIDEYHFPWAVIGEPTDLVACLSCYGYLEIQVAATGKRVHASMAKNRRNATETLLHTMLRVSHFLRENHPELVYNFRDLYSNPSGFSTPDRCEAWLDIHAPANAPLGEIVTALEEVSLETPNDQNIIEPDFRIETIDAGYALPEKGALVNSLRAACENTDTPWKTGDFQSHSDANQLWRAGIKPVVMGPGSLAEAHSTDESVSFDQVCRAAEIYLHMLRAFFA